VNTGTALAACDGQPAHDGGHPDADLQHVLDDARHRLAPQRHRVDRCQGEDPGEHK